MSYEIKDDTVIDGTITADNLTGTSSGTNTGDQTSVTGNAGTVTSIGNLTGEVTSVNRATVLDPTAVTGKTTVTVAAGDFILISDTSDSGNLKKIAASDVMGALSDGDYGDITVSGTGTVLTIDNDVVSNTKLSDMATSTFKGRTTAGTGDPEDLNIAQAKTLLNLTGTNSGDQTSIVGITGTIAQFNTALTDGDFATGGGTATGTNTGDQTSVTGNAGTVSDIGNLTGEVTSTNRATTLASPAITNRTAETPVAADYLLFSDTSDSGNLKKALVSTLPAGVDSTAIHQTGDESASGIKTFTDAVRGTPAALTAGATVTPDFATANDFTLTPNQNFTLANPTNVVVGQSGSIKITQDATPRTIAYGTSWKFSGAVLGVLTAIAGRFDTLYYDVRSATHIEVSLLADTR